MCIVCMTAHLLFFPLVADLGSEYIWALYSSLDALKHKMNNTRSTALGKAVQMHRAGGAWM